MMLQWGGEGGGGKPTYYISINKKINPCNLPSQDTNNRDGELKGGAGAKDRGNKILWFRRRDLPNLLCIGSVAFNPFCSSPSGSAGFSQKTRPDPPSAQTCRELPRRCSCTTLPPFSTFDVKLGMKEVGKVTERRSYEWRLPQHLLQFPQELDGPSGCDVGPVEERQAAAVDGEGVVGDGVVCGAGAHSSTIKATLQTSSVYLCFHSRALLCFLTALFRLIPVLYPFITPLRFTAASLQSQIFTANCI